MAWIYPEDRYYYDWLGQGWPSEPTDGEIKATVVERLHNNPKTADDQIRVDVKQGVILGGTVSNWVAKRAAGDDAWDTPGVVDVSNQLSPARGAA